MSEQVRIPVTEVDEYGIISVRHGLGPDAVVLACETVEGLRIGAVSANTISDEEIEIVQVPGGPPIATVVLSVRNDVGTESAG